MIGLDTNVLLRLLLRDDEAQFGRVVAHIETGAWGAGAYVNSVVLIEAVWVLLKRMKRPKSEVIEFVDRLLSTQDIVFADEAAVVRALARYKTTSCDFADSLIAEINTEAGIRSTISFDSDALELGIFSPIPLSASPGA